MDIRAPVALLVLLLISAQIVKCSVSRPIRLASPLLWKDQDTRLGLQIVARQPFSDEQSLPASSSDTSHSLPYDKHEALTSRPTKSHGATPGQTYKTIMYQIVSAQGTQLHGDVQTSAQATQSRAKRADDSSKSLHITYRHLMATDNQATSVGLSAGIIAMIVILSAIGAIILGLCCVGCIRGCKSEAQGQQSRQAQQNKGRPGGSQLSARGRTRPVNATDPGTMQTLQMLPYSDASAAAGGGCSSVSGATMGHSVTHHGHGGHHSGWGLGGDYSGGWGDSGHCGHHGGGDGGGGFGGGGDGGGGGGFGGGGDGGGGGFGGGGGGDGGGGGGGC